MSSSPKTLQDVVEGIEEKADQYEEAANYDTKKQQYRSSLSSMESSLSRLKRKVESMEFLIGVLTEVHGRDLPVGGTVQVARNQVRSVISRDPGEFYELAADGREDQYDESVQEAISKVDAAKSIIKDELRDVETEWQDRIQSARNIQKLVGESREMSKTINEIEQFVERRMRDETETVQTLTFQWEELHEDWQQGDVDWDTFQREHGLSDETMDVLRDLSSKGEIKLGTLSDETAEEMLSVKSLRDVVTLNI
jgi:DNA repair exonuclease SbcCD ATPase subunit